MKSYGVTIQMNPFQQYFHMVLFVSYVVLTIESMDDIHVVTIRMKPLEWNLFSGTFTWYYMLYNIFQNEI